MCSECAEISTFLSCVLSGDFVVDVDVDNVVMNYAANADFATNYHDSFDSMGHDDSVLQQYA